MVEIDYKEWYVVINWKTKYEQIQNSTVKLISLIKSVDGWLNVVLRQKYKLSAIASQAIFDEIIIISSLYGM